MMTVSMGLSKMFDETAAAKALEGAMPLVEEMCAHLLKEKQRELGNIPRELLSNVLPPAHISDGGFRRQAVTRDDFQRLLRPWKRALGQLMLRYPRNKDETHTDYFRRLRSDVGDHDGWWGHFDRMKVWLAHIHRIDEEEAAKADRERQAEAQRRRNEEESRRKARAEMERQASPDPKEIGAWKRSSQKLA